MSESESEKLKSALHALAGLLAKPRATEKTKAVLGQPETPVAENAAGPAPGHGRNGASSYTRTKKVAIPHPTLQAGDLAGAATNNKSNS